MKINVPASMKCLARAYCEGGSCPKCCSFRVNEKLGPAQIAKKPGLSLGRVFVRLCYHELGNTAPWTWGAICLQVVQEHKAEMAFLHDFKIYCHPLCMYKNHMSVTAPNTEINLSCCKTCKSGKDMSDHTFCFSCKTVCFIWWNSLQEAQHVPGFATFSDFSGSAAKRKQFPL